MQLFSSIVIETFIFYQCSENFQFKLRQFGFSFPSFSSIGEFIDASFKLFLLL